ncbi:SusF/SusE family outer membrane protein [Salinimicrobium sp. MT39]|uniref:SusF/SusE family outer membrane protein n=1 Tax=Salinimicrobium profundisediminis TaxID=2994553 RepID=A0A9X3I231_9FLAO|nr:SusF/SusE family outer membrane protein [Salinimicrobium profundisediminis]MCX2839078.1 SusF/SusE family outer membrane protein [Salinimicrobium profundisediminis]
MKKYMNKLFFLGTLLVLMCSCEKDTELTTLQEVNFPSPPDLSSISLQLVQDEQNEPALNISWGEVIFPIDAPVEYTVQFALPADTIGESGWNNTINFNAGKDVYSKTFQVLDLNQIAEEVGFEPDVEGDLVVRVLAHMDRTIASEAVGLTVIPFETVITLTELYLPGAYQGWDPSTSLSIPSTGVNGIYQGIIYFPEEARDFKITLDQTWDENYGGDGNGNLIFDGSNLSVPTGGTYSITVNLNTMRWSAEPYSFGIIGTATPGGWDADTNMFYDSETETWQISTYLQAGALKWRLNDAWTVNYGPRNNDEGTAYLDDPGAYTISEAGMYEVTFKVDSQEPSIAYYTIEPISWGIIGDATAGGWDADTDMTYDPEADVWRITAELISGAVKFRRNNTWAINYGPRNNDDGILYLDDPGAHGISEVGTYEITLHLNSQDQSTANYTIEKID